MPSKLSGNHDCPKNEDNRPAVSCVAKYITATSCTVSGGKWVKFITNYLEKTQGVLETCEKKDYKRLVKGLPYEPHMHSTTNNNNNNFINVSNTF